MMPDALVAHVPLPHDYQTGYDYAVQHGQYTVSQYLSLGNQIRNHAPSPPPEMPPTAKTVGPAPGFVGKKMPQVNTLVFGGGYDTPLYVFANPEGMTLVIEDRPEWIALTKRICAQAPSTPMIHGIDYDRPVLEPIVKDTVWEFIFVDGRSDPAAFKVQCEMAKALKRPHAWVYVARGEITAQRAVATQVFGPPDSVIKSMAGHPEKTFLVYAGRHRHPFTKEFLA